MSQQGRSTLGFKLQKETKDYIENTLNTIMNQRKLDKGSALLYIVTSFNDTSIKNENINFSKPPPFDCNFLNNTGSMWECFEPMSSSKKPIELGIDEETVRSKCKACYEGHQIKENERKRKQLERDNIRNLIKFYKDFLQLTKGGFDVSVTMCKGNLLEKSSMIFSRDGEVLFCPLQNMELVVINEVCKEITNTITKGKGCKYLITLDHHVNYKGSKAEESIKEILPQLSKLDDEKEE